MAKVDIILIFSALIILTLTMLMSCGDDSNLIKNNNAKLELIEYPIINGQPYPGAIFACTNYADLNECFELLKGFDGKNGEIGPIGPQGEPGQDGKNSPKHCNKHGKCKDKDD